MGSLVAAMCPDCQLTRQLALGGGFVNFMTTAAVPAGCATCRELVTVNAKDAEPRACVTPGCAGTPSIIGEVTTDARAMSAPTVFTWLVDDATGTQYVLLATPYACPACGGPRLTFGVVGNWD